MGDNGTEREPKRARDVQPEVADVMLVARKMWQRKDPFLRATAQQEDRNFRSSFGCGPFVALRAWTMLSDQYLVPEKGTLEHFLWTLSFMKVYGKTRDMQTLCGGADPSTIRKRVWLFIEAIADLEPDVVRDRVLYCCMLCVDTPSCLTASCFHTDCLGQSIQRGCRS